MPPFTLQVNAAKLALKRGGYRCSSPSPLHPDAGVNYYWKHVGGPRHKVEAVTPTGLSMEQKKKKHVSEVGGGDPETYF